MISNVLPNQTQKAVSEGIFSSKFSVSVRRRAGRSFPVQETSSIPVTRWVIGKGPAIFFSSYGSLISSPAGPAVPNHHSCKPLVNWHPAKGTTPPSGLQRPKRAPSPSPMTAEEAPQEGCTQPPGPRRQNQYRAAPVQFAVSVNRGEVPSDPEPGDRRRGDSLVFPGE